MIFRPCKPEDVIKKPPVLSTNIFVCNYTQNGLDDIFTITPGTEKYGVFINLEKRNERTFEDRFSHYVDHYYLIYKTLNNHVVEELLGVDFGDGYRGFSFR